MWLRILIVSAFVFGPVAALAKPKRDCEASMRLKPGETEYMLSRGICHLNNGDTDLAISDFDRFIGRNPGWVGGYFNRGNAHFAKGNFDLAIADYSEALRRQPADPDGIFWNRGNAWAEQHDYVRAIEDYDQAIRLKPKFADYYRIRAEVYEKRGERDMAMLDYSKAVALEPGNQAAKNGLRHLAATSRVPSPESPPRVTIDKPRYGDYRLDWCRYWAHGCGKPAADEFCRRHGFAESASFAQEPRIGRDDPTTVIGSGQICNQRTCNGFASVTCRK
jgi:tetratricopeptide (TPR) repeat protein